MKRAFKLGSAASIVLSAAFILGPVSAFAATTVVKQADLDAGPNITTITSGSVKWFMYNDTTDVIDNTLGSFVTGPATPPSGLGSVEFTLGATPDDRKNIATYRFANTMLSSITDMSYTAYSHSGVSGPNESPYLAFNVDFDGSDTWQSRLVYVPTANGPVPQDAWNTFDTISGGAAKWVYSGATWPTSTGPDAALVSDLGTNSRTWSAILADYPDARILQTGGWLGVRVGEPGPTGYIGNIDSFTMNGNTFDFEPTLPEACISSSTFDTATANSSVNGQEGWTEANTTYDQEIVDNLYGFTAFGCKTLRVSNAVTSGAFDWIYSPSVTNEAGETTAVNSGLSGGTRQNHFEAQFDLASAVPGAQQSGLQVSVSPDRGDGARMSYLRFADQSSGIHVYFDDYATSTTFTETDIATLDRSTPHTIKFVMDFVDGPANDVVSIYIDGTLKHTGTSWEDYFRDNQPTIAPPTVDSLLIQARDNQGGDVPANDGKGFLFDNFSLSSGATAPAAPVVCPEGQKMENDVCVDLPEAHRRSSGGGGGGNSNNSGGQVLGAETETPGQGQMCSTVLLVTYMRQGMANNPAEVMKLQTFLNGNVNAGLPITGFFGPLTEAAVKTFQVKYSSDILAPWGLLQPTGYVFKTTQWKINMLNCAALNIPAPQV